MNASQHAVDDILARKYDALIGELAERMDLRSGATECAAIAHRHGELVDGLAEELDLDAGLRAIASNMAQEHRATATPPPTSEDDDHVSSAGGTRRHHRPHRWSGRAVLAARICVAGPLTTTMRSSLVGLAWRWRHELATALILWTSYAVLSHVAHPLAPVAALASLAVVVTTVPSIRWYVRRWIRAVVVQHRLRAGFAQAGLVTPRGRYPVILRARSQDRWVRLTIWSPAGLTPEDFRAVGPVLAAACTASEVLAIRSVRSPSVLHLIVAFE